MHSYLKIQSSGEIDVLAFTLLGGTTKEDDNKTIGMFGSGLKYSISSLIRNNIHFIVFSGEERLEFNTKTVKFRDKEFEVIYINNIETSLTTSMGGKIWDTSFAPIREIYSNALDEDANAILGLTTSNIKGEKGKTTFYIQTSPQILDFYENRDLYFIQKEPLEFNTFGAIHDNGMQYLRLYRRGILAHKSTWEKAMFRYDSHRFKINESRVVSCTWTAERIVQCIWRRCDNITILKLFVAHISSGNTGTYERSILWVTDMNLFEGKNLDSSFSEAWGDIVDNNKFIAFEHLDMFLAEDIGDRIKLPYNLLKALVLQFGDRVDMLQTHVAENGRVFVKIKEPDQDLVDNVIDAIVKLKKTQYAKRMVEVPKINYVKFENKNTLGMALDKEIYLSDKLNVYSVDEIARIIIEENEHILTDFQDESREFQDHLFKLYYNELIR